MANSTFSRRTKDGEEKRKLWRLPVKSDEIILKIAEAIGFERAEIWVTRSLQPKNVAGADAKESIVVARKLGI